jgi:uncharacterized integral membrane protein
MAPTPLTSEQPSQGPALDDATPTATRDRVTTDDGRAGRQRERDARRQTPQPLPTPQPHPSAETRGARVARKAHRSRLHVYALFAVVVLVYVVALAASNTGQVTVNWVFGSSSVALVWLVLFAAILGWVLGILVTAVFRWRTRAPRTR